MRQSGRGSQFGKHLESCQTLSAVLMNQSSRGIFIGMYGFRVLV